MSLINYYLNIQLVCSAYRYSTIFKFLVQLRRSWYLGHCWVKARLHRVLGYASNGSNRRLALFDFFHYSYNVQVITGYFHIDHGEESVANFKKKLVFHSEFETSSPGILN